MKRFVAKKGLLKHPILRMPLKNLDKTRRERRKIAHDKTLNPSLIRIKCFLFTRLSFLQMSI